MNTISVSAKAIKYMQRIPTIDGSIILVDKESARLAQEYEWKVDESGKPIRVRTKRSK